MDTNRLKRFATEARKILMQGVVHRLQAIGFDADGTPVEEPQLFSGGATFMGDTVSTGFYDKWQSLASAIRQRSIKEVAEEAAYTWFNRLMAIRIMVKNDLIPPVLQYESEGVFVPLLVTEARQGRLPDMKEDERRKLMVLLDDDSKTTEQFSILIVAFCHSTPIINNCFGTISDYTELLLPTNILAEGGFIDLINHTDFIAEEDYKSPELIGWLYQFYISDRKDEAFAKKGKYDPDEIAPATQIFTPNWIVKYMVENTVGRIWLDNNLYSDIKEGMNYLVDVQEGLPILKIDEPQQLTAADLASGSGHILNECFDLFYKIYQEEGYNRRSAIENIFQHNILGIDLDMRAKQLAQFALLMKACQKDASFLDGKLMPRVYTMPRPIGEILPDFEQALTDFLMGSNSQMISELKDAILLMDHADTLGSIMKFNLSESTRNTVMIRTKEYDEMLSNGEIIAESNRLLLPYMRIILALTDKYAAICMNPPYMGSGRFDDTLSKYVKDNYEQSKADLFSVFMDVAIDHLTVNGKYGMINMHSWMFLSSFEKLRRNLLDNYHIDSLLHLGPRTFDELSGEVVQNAAFIISKARMQSVSNLETNNSQFGNNSFPVREQDVPSKGTSSPQGADSESEVSKLAVRSELTDSGTYYRLVEGKDCSDKQRLFFNVNDSSGINYCDVSQGNFERIPGCSIGYWLSEQMLSLFEKPQLSDKFKPRAGLTTTDNDRFLRFWQEVSLSSIYFNGRSRDDLKLFTQKWVPMTKGGTFRKWYGNNEYILNFANDGEELKYWITHNPSDPKTKSYSRYIRNYDKYLESGISFSDVASGTPHFRWQNEGMIPNSRGPYIYTGKKYVMGFLNGIVAKTILELLSPTLSFNVGDIGRLPLVFNEINNEELACIDNLVRNNIAISKADWDAHETSWDFEANSIVALCNQYAKDGCKAISYRIENFVNEFETRWEDYFKELHANEEELNRQYIEIYGLQDELTPDVPKDEITILQQGEISIESNELKWHRDVLMKQLISYALGCMMGRYSIDKPGLILANQGDGLDQFNELVPNSRFDVDDDGIIPLMSAQSDFADNATIRFKHWLTVTFGEDMLVDNLNFIERALGKSIDDYFVKDFWKDHKKMYQNRPIYWLFSSKKGAFQCLAYMHRMDAYTAERIRTKYLLPHIEWLMQKQGELEANAADLTNIERKQLDSIIKQITECREYHDRLHVVADQQIAFDLDDGVVVNYAKFGDVLSKIK